MSENINATPAAGASGSKEPSIDLFLPLADYEKELIISFIQDMQWHSVVESLALDPADLGHRLHHAFLHWHWTRRFMNAFQEVCDDDEWVEFHHGGWKLIWDSIERVMPLSRAEADNFRFVDLKAPNNSLDSLPFSKTLCRRMVPRAVPEDANFWVVISELVAYYELAEPPKERSSRSTAIPTSPSSPSTRSLTALACLPDVERHSSPLSIWRKEEEIPENDLRAYWDDQWEFNIWSLLRACGTIVRRRADSLDTVKEGLALTGFYALHDRVWNGYVRNDREREESSVVPQPQYGYTLSAKARRIFEFGDDPLKYIEFIPWDDLEEIDEREKIVDDIGDRRVVVWHPARSTEWERQLFTEDDLFRASVLRGFYFPGERYKGSVMFALSPITDFELETTNKGGFWGYWNDCSITQDPDNNTWYLLETIPGLRFRRLEQEFDDYAARAYFRALVEQNIQGRTEELREALGMHFQPKYQNLLTLIPCSQISDVQTKPIGEGSRGLVYKAVWNQSSGITGNKIAKLDVALKSIKISETHELQRFLVELDRTFASVSGLQGRLIELYGLLRTPPHDAQKADHNDSSTLPPDTYFLVIEFALLGPLDDYLKQHLQGTDSDWPLLIRLMYDTAVGIYEIHSRGVLHRDIHWGNVLVTTRPYGRGAGPIVHSTEALIADLGEAQFINSQPNRRTYYGNRDFWAPEVRTKHIYSPASDVYALGVLLSQMVSLHWNARALVAKQMHGDESREMMEMPCRLLAIILACLSEDVNQRPSAGEVFTALGELESVVKTAWDSCERVELSEEDVEGIFQVGVSSGEVPPQPCANHGEQDDIET